MPSLLDLRDDPPPPPVASRAVAADPDSAELREHLDTLRAGNPVRYE